VLNGQTISDPAEYEPLWYDLLAPALGTYPTAASTADLAPRERAAGRGITGRPAARRRRHPPASPDGRVPAAPPRATQVACSGC
jgi:hypothetical protein